MKEGEKVFLVKSSKDGGVCGGWALVTRDHITEGWVPRNFLGLEYEQIRHMVRRTLFNLSDLLETETKTKATSFL